MITLAPPAIYLALLIVATRPEAPEYVLPGPTVMTVSDKGGPVVLHGPEAVYPAQALRDRIEGSVGLKVTVADDGTVTSAVPISGPAPLRQAAAENVRRWQFEPKAVETQIDVGFSLRTPTQSLELPQPVKRVAPKYKGPMHGSVRVVATVNPRGRVEFVQPVSGPELLVPAALQSVRRWTFRPALRNGEATYGTAIVDVAFL